jgi:hypothetical protein
MPVHGRYHWDMGHSARYDARPLQVAGLEKRKIEHWLIQVKDKKLKSNQCTFEYTTLKLQDE